MNIEPIDLIGILVICKLLDEREILIKEEYKKTEFKIHYEAVVNSKNPLSIRNLAIAKLIEKGYRNPRCTQFNGVDATLISTFPEYGIMEDLNKNSVGVILTINENNFENININIY